MNWADRILAIKEMRDVVRESILSGDNVDFLSRVKS
jgi:hypothetical protein